MPAPALYPGAGPNPPKEGCPYRPELDTVMVVATGRQEWPVPQEEGEAKVMTAKPNEFGVRYKAAEDGGDAR